MKQFFGMSKRGDLQEAISGLKSPQAILLLSNVDQFEDHVAQLEAAFPGVPSIGCIDMCYDIQVVEKGVGVVAYEGVTALAGVLEQVSVMPVKYIQRFMEDMNNIKAGPNDTVCIDFCTGNDACVLAAVGSVIANKKISLVGGTGDAGKVSANGKIYTDADAYIFIKNNNGRVGVYKENIYGPMEESCRMITAETDRSNIMGELKDYREVVVGTINQIRHDFSHISGVFSVNCLFRYLLVTQKSDIQEYLRAMSKLGNHAGMISCGEHYNNQLLNQTMTCVVFGI